MAVGVEGRVALGDRRRALGSCLGHRGLVLGIARAGRDLRRGDRCEGSAPRVGQQVPFGEQLGQHAVRIQSAPALDPQQTRGLAAGNVRLRRRSGYAAHEGRDALPVPDRKAQGHEGVAPLEWPDYVLELQRLFDLVVVATLVDTRPVDRLGRWKLCISTTDQTILGRAEESGKACVGANVAAVEVLQPDERRALVERSVEKRAAGVAERGQLLGGQRQQDVAAAAPVRHGRDIDGDPIEPQDGSVGLAIEHPLELGRLQAEVLLALVPPPKRLGAPLQLAVLTEQGECRHIRDGRQSSHQQSRGVRITPTDSVSARPCTEACAPPASGRMSA